MAEAKVKNQEFFVSKLPQGFPTTDIWELKDTETPSAADLKDGQVLLKSLFVSVDPYLRGRLRMSKVGDQQISGTVAEVIESKNADIAKGTIVQGYFPWARYFVTSGKLWKELRPVDPSVAPISTANGVLGMPGMTAYFGLNDVGKCKEGEQVLVSGAAGAVGSLVIQLAKLKKCHVVGVVGSQDKADYIVKELGADAAIVYKDFPTEEALGVELKKLMPKGIDVYFDNVGGVVTDAVFDLINPYARVVICGQIAEYNDLEKRPVGPRFLYKLIYKNASIHGFVVSQFNDRAKEFFEAVGPLVKQGKIKFHETILEGFEKIPEAFVGLFTGLNTGKLQVKV